MYWASVSREEQDTCVKLAKLHVAGGMRPRRNEKRVRPNTEALSEFQSLRAVLRRELAGDTVAGTCGNRSYKV